MSSRAGFALVSVSVFGWSPLRWDIISEWFQIRIKVPPPPLLCTARLLSICECHDTMKAAIKNSTPQLPLPTGHWPLSACFLSGQLARLASIQRIYGIMHSHKRHVMVSARKNQSKCDLDCSYDLPVHRCAAGLAPLERHRRILSFLAERPLGLAVARPARVAQQLFDASRFAHW